MVRLGLVVEVMCKYISLCSKFADHNVCECDDNSAGVNFML